MNTEDSNKKPASLGLRIACISDTHCQLESLVIPFCDLILHAGDLSYRGELPEVLKELDWLKYHANFVGAKAVLTPGNHDWIFQYHPDLMKDECRKRGIFLLQHEAMIYKHGEKDYKIFGSPYQPEFCDWAFNVPRGPKLAEKWAQIPEDTEILITHGPPHMVLDRIPARYVKEGSVNPSPNVGCEDLSRRLPELKKLKLHVFGHIHYSYGQEEKLGVQYVNASNCTERYKPSNPVIIKGI
jgi:predicted phosphodiesterase